MEIKDLVGLEKPTLKLIEVVSEGMGEVGNAVFQFDSKKMKRIGAAEAEVEKAKIIKRAEGSSKALEILNRAGKRFALEQYNKQINLENIIVDSKENLEGKEVSDEPVDKDWAFRFMNIAQDVSRDDMQKLLSKILAEEVIKPGSFSLRTLDYVKNLSKPDLFLLKKIALISSGYYVYKTKESSNNGFFNISYGEILQLIEMNFIQSSTTTVAEFEDIKANSKFKISVNRKDYIFTFTEDQINFKLPVLSLTSIGRELSSLMPQEENDEKVVSEYITQLANFWKTKKMVL